MQSWSSAFRRAGCYHAMINHRRRDNLLDQRLPVDAAVEFCELTWGQAANRSSTAQGSRLLGLADKQVFGREESRIGGPLHEEEVEG